MLVTQKKNANDYSHWEKSSFDIVKTLIEENVAAVGKAFDFSQEKPIWRASSEMNVGASSIQRILRRELKLFCN